MNVVTSTCAGRVIFKTRSSVSWTSRWNVAVIENRGEAGQQLVMSLAANHVQNPMYSGFNRMVKGSHLNTIPAIDVTK